MGLEDCLAADQRVIVTMLSAMPALVAAGSKFSERTRQSGTNKIDDFIAEMERLLNDLERGSTRAEPYKSTKENELQHQRHLSAGAVDSPVYESFKARVTSHHPMAAVSSPTRTSTDSFDAPADTQKASYHRVTVEHVRIVPRRRNKIPRAKHSQQKVVQQPPTRSLSPPVGLTTPYSDPRSTPFVKTVVQTVVSTPEHPELVLSNNLTTTKMGVRPDSLSCTPLKAYYRQSPTAATMFPSFQMQNNTRVFQAVPGLSLDPQSTTAIRVPPVILQAPCVTTLPQMATFVSNPSGIPIHQPVAPPPPYKMLSPPMPVPTITAAQIQSPADSLQAVDGSAKESSADDGTVHDPIITKLDPEGTPQFPKWRPPPSTAARLKHNRATSLERGETSAAADVTPIVVTNRPALVLPTQRDGSRRPFQWAVPKSNPDGFLGYLPKRGGKFEIGRAVVYGQTGGNATIGNPTMTGNDESNEMKETAEQCVAPRSCPVSSPEHQTQCFNIASPGASGIRD